MYLISVACIYNMDYRKFHGKAGYVHSVWYHGKAVCLRQDMTNTKEFKEDKEFKDKTNDCTQSRADEDADATV